MAGHRLENVIYAYLPLWQFILCLTFINHVFNRIFDTMGFKCHDKRLQALSGRKIKSKSFVDMITSTTTSFVQVSVQVS